MESVDSAIDSKYQPNIHSNGDELTETGADRLPKENGSSDPSTTADITDKTSFVKSLNEATPLCSAMERVSFFGLLRRHWHSTVVYCAVFWSFGMSVSFLGPTLLDLGCQTSSDLKHTSWLFLPQTLCTLIGATSAGFLVGRLSPNFVLVVASILISLSMLVIPFCRNILSLCLVLAVMGLQMGAIDCLANLQMITVFDGAVSPFLQAMHFCYGLGAFLSPMISEPFLLNEDCSSFIDHPGHNSSWYNGTTYPATTLVEAQDMTRVRFAFWIMSALQVPIPLLTLTLAWKDTWWINMGTRHLEDHQNLASPDDNNRKESREKHDTTSTRKNPKFFNALQHLSMLPRDSFNTKWSKIVAITAIAASIVWLYDGMQSGFAGYVYTYGVKSIADMDKTEAAYLNACFWGTFAMGRLVSIPIAVVFSPAFMLMCNITGCVVSTSTMLGFPHDHTVLYVGTGLLGLFISSVYPTTLSLAEQYIDLNSSLTTVIIVTASVGEMTFPLIIGQLFYHLGPFSLLAFTMAAACVSVLLYLIFVVVGRTTPKHSVVAHGSFIWCQTFWLDYVGNRDTSGGYTRFVDME